MDKHDIEYVKKSNDIVSVINKYVPLKKNGKNYTACCPFHSEKTPSFTVDEQKQFYHCFGCGAHGDVISFVMEYSGLDFKEAYKELGGAGEFQASATVLKNIKAAEKIKKFKAPDDDKQDGELANKILSKCVSEHVGGVDFFKYKGGYVLPVYNADFELVNAVNFRHGQTMQYIAGGLTYGGFTPVKVNDSDNWLACVSLADGRYLAHELNINVAVCWDGYSMKYLCKWNHGEMKVWPVIRECDDDWLCYEMNWVKLKEDKTVEKMKCLN